nr:MAG TPA: hypothetical protein [Caudoviricetes sp.]
MRRLLNNTGVVLLSPYHTRADVWEPVPKWNEL